MIRKVYVATDGSEHISPNLVGALSATQSEHGFRVTWSDGERNVTIEHEDFGAKSYQLEELYEAA